MSSNTANNNAQIEDSDILELEKTISDLKLNEPDVDVSYIKDIEQSINKLKLHDEEIDENATYNDVVQAIDKLKVECQTAPPLIDDELPDVGMIIFPCPYCECAYCECSSSSCACSLCECSYCECRDDDDFYVHNIKYDSRRL